MSETRRKFDQDFKEGVVRLVRQTGKPITRVLQLALNATGTPPSHRLLVTGGLGAVLGALIGAIGAIALGRSHRLFRMK